MKVKYLVLSIGIFILLIGSVYAMNINFFYSPSCSYCESVFPLVESSNQDYSSEYYSWNSYDVSQGSYNVNSVPTIKIKTNDCREIELVGASEIFKHLNCELQEMTTEECPTHYDQPIGGSWFIDN